METGLVDINFTLIFQVINTLIIVGIIYAIVHLLVKIPKRMKEKQARLDRIEYALNDINKKLDNK